MKVTSVNNVKIYNVNTGRSLPQWISDRKKRKLLKEDTELRQRIQLLQDFEMPTASTRIKMTPDQQHIMATGVYKPRVRCYETAELSMKFERAMDCEVVQFQILSEDWRKMVFLQADRHVEFHAQFGRYFKTRIPKHGRDLAYHSGSAELYLVGASSEIWRLNLEAGRFMASLQGSGSEFNVCKINPVHQLITAGSVNGTVEVWDPRDKQRAGVLDVRGQSEQRQGAEVSALRYHQDGLSMAVGMSNGEVLVYDIRANKPTMVKDHQYGFPIKDLKFHTSGNVISTDTKIVKIWDRHTGHNFTTIEPEADINDTCVPEGSGLVMTANEDKNMNAYFIPELGPAPRWCHFLDTIAEELEESEQTVMYDDFKFVTKSELDQLGLSSLVGTKLLRAYMHGFFMDMRLYNKAKAIAEPFAYEAYRKDAIKKRIEEKRANRIGLVKKLPKVNKDYAATLMSKNAQDRTQGAADTSALADSRFGALWKNPDFAIDLQSDEFKSRHPAWAKDKVLQQFQPAVDDEESEPEGRPSDEDTDESEDDMSEDERPAKNQPKAKAGAKAPGSGPNMFELKEDARFSHDQRGLADVEKQEKLRKVPLGARIAKEAIEPVESVAHVAGKVHTFQYKTKRDAAKEAKEREREQQLKEHIKERREARRGVKELGLKRGPVYWRGKRVMPK